MGGHRQSGETVSRTTVRPPRVANAICVPVFNAVTFGYDDMNDWFDVAVGKKPGHIYSRNTNPTVRPLEEKIRIMDGGEEATSFSTGMAAISNTLFTLLKPGDRVVAIKDTYGGSNKVFIEFLPRLNVEVCLCDTSDFEAIEREVKQGCKVLYTRPCYRHRLFDHPRQLLLTSTRASTNRRQLQILTVRPGH
jgi:O-acetylhomoserine/O-acetylserine sulfhydrylase-like pyridoxal-dependent enzyme